MYEQYIPFDIHKPYKQFVGVFIQCCIVQMGKQDRTNPSNYDYPDKYQVHSSERNQNFVQEKMIGDIGHICRVTLGLPMLERLKQMIVHLTTVVPNWQSRPWFAPSYLRISSIASQSTQSVGDTSIDLALQRFTTCTKLAPKYSRFALKCDTILQLHDACPCQDKKIHKKA